MSYKTNRIFVLFLRKLIHYLLYNITHLPDLVSVYLYTLLLFLSFFYVCDHVLGGKRLNKGLFVFYLFVRMCGKGADVLSGVIMPWLVLLLKAAC